MEATLVQEINGLKVGDIVRYRDSPVAYRLERIEVFPANPEGWGSFMPVKKDGTRDRRRTPFSGSLAHFTKG